MATEILSFAVTVRINIAEIAGCRRGRCQLRLARPNSRGFLRARVGRSHARKLFSDRRRASGFAAEAPNPCTGGDIPNPQISITPADAGVCHRERDPIAAVLLSVIRIDRDGAAFGTLGLTVPLIMQMTADEVIE